MSKLDDLLDYLVIGDNPITGDHVLEVWKDGDITEAKTAIKALFLELILSADKEVTGNESTDELAKLSGRKDAVIELCEKAEAL